MTAVTRYFPYTSPESVILLTPVARFNGTPLVSLRFPSVPRFHPVDLAANPSRTRLSWRLRAASTVLRVESTALRCVAPLNSVEPTALLPFWKPISNSNRSPSCPAMSVRDAAQDALRRQCLRGSIRGRRFSGRVNCWAIFSSSSGPNHEGQQSKHFEFVGR